jgi:Rrf2 family iron-sulfur cluster assembly transcriptional regulator
MLMRRERAYTAIAVMLDIGWHAGRQRLESAGDIADRLAMARRGIEPVLQALARVGLLDSTRGPKGGYRLGRSARQINLAEIVEAVTSADGGEEAVTEAGGELQTAAVEPLWVELEQHVQAHLQAITLEALIQRAQVSGLKRPAHAPIVFAI